jgi:hypothetical protein
VYAFRRRILPRVSLIRLSIEPIRQFWLGSPNFVIIPPFLLEIDSGDVTC